MSAQGEEIDRDLRPNAAAMLAFLQSRAGETVSKQALMDAVWPDTHVTENSLYQCVAELRRHLEGSGQELRNVPRRGYRLVSVADGQATDKAAFIPPGIRRYLYGTAALAALLMAAASHWWLLRPEGDANPPAIRVAAFESFNDDPRWTRLGAAIAGDIANALADSPLLRVSFRDDGSAHYDLTGSVLEEQAVVQVQARLTDRATGQILWGETWRGPSDKLFDMQEQITARVAGTVSSEWSGEVAKHARTLAHLRGTDDLDAYEHFVIGVEHKHRFTPRDYELAAAHLRAAIALDPGFHKAWSSLAVVHALRGSNAATPEALEPIFAARIAAIEAAAALAPDDPQVLVQSNWLNGHRREVARAEQVLRRAVELAPNNADVLAEAAWIGNWRSEVGADSVAWSDRARALNPDWPDWYAVGAGMSRFNLGRYEEAVAELEAAPDFIERHLYTAAAEAHLGDMRAARAATARLLALKPDFNLETYITARAIHEPAVRARLESGARKAGVPFNPPASAAASSD